jgi:hypothetical protein
MTEADIRHRLSGVKYDCLFDDRLYRRLRDALTTRKTRMLNALARLEETQNAELQYFWEEPARSNLLTFIYWCMGSDAAMKLREQNKRTLSRFPDNVAALTMNLRLIVEQGKSLGDAKAILERLAKFDDQANDPTHQILLCEGEVAFAFQYLGPAFYVESIDRYEKVISQYEAKVREASDSGNRSVGSAAGGFVNRLCSWHFHLAQATNRLLNRDGLQRLHGRRANSLKDVYDSLCNHLTLVLETDDVAYKGRAMIELVDAYKKCKKLSKNGTMAVTADDEDRVEETDDDGESGSIRFPYSGEMTVDEFVELALRESPDDPYVLERCGRHYRQQARTEDEFLHAISILDLCPSRHVAWHHKGLAYVRMSCNVRKAGGSNHQPYHHSGGRGGSRGGRGSRGGGRQRFGEGSSSSSSSGRWDSHNGSDSSSLDKARIYMTKAKASFMEANRLSGGTCCRYLVDFARACSSLGDDAEEHYLAAEKLTRSPEEVDDVDTSYLYEQWAMLKTRSLSRYAHGDNTRWLRAAKAAAALYRKAIRSNVLGGIGWSYGSKRSTESLRDLVRQQLDRDPMNKILKQESDLLRTALEYYSDNSHPLVEAVRQSSDVTGKVWLFVDVLTSEEMAATTTQQRNAEDKFDDANTAFLYLTILKSAGKLQSVDSRNPETALRRAVEVAMKLSSSVLLPRQALVETKTTIPMDLPMRNVFRWAVGDNSMSARGFKTDSDAFIADDDDLDLCLLTATQPSDGDKSTELLVTILQSVIGLNIVSFRSSSNVDGVSVVDDSGEQRLRDDIEAFVGRSKSVIIITDGHDDGNKRRSSSLSPVIERLHAVPAARVCVVVITAGTCVDRTAAAGDIATSYGRWPRVFIDDQTSPRNIACSVIEAFNQVSTASLIEL